MAMVPIIHNSTSELRAAARMVAWRDSVSPDVLESIVAKVAALADRQRLAVMLREAVNDDGGGG